ncbi:MAG TPA: hypothetical protein VGK53_12580 [Propionicimonas sp.]
MAEWISAVAAVLAAVFAGAAWIVASRARKDSGRSADASEVSANAAAETAQIARADTARRVERHDVAWEFVQQPDDAHSLLEFRNVGVTPAHNVEAALTIDGLRADLPCGTIPPNQTFTYDAQDRYKEAEERWQKGLDAGFFGSPGIDVEVRILWTSELGSPAIWTGTIHA